MVLNNIEKLLEKYENGETTLQEEQQLKNYFKKETIAPHLEMYRPMFAYFSVNQNEQFTRDVPLKSKNVFNYKWISVAAVAVVMLGVFMQISGPNAQQEREALLAYNQTLDALGMVSTQLTKGSENLEALSLMSESFSKGTENIAYLNEFSSSTNKIFKAN